MELRELLTAEVILLAVLLFALVAATIIILGKMKPLKEFNNIKFGKIELTRGKAETERDNKQDDALGKLLELVHNVGRRLDAVDDKLKGVDARLDVHYKYIKKAVVNAGIAVTWSDKGAPYEETAQAALTNIALGQNSNLDGRLKEVIMGKQDGIKDFYSIYNRFVNDKENEDLLKDNPRFYERVKEVTKGMK